MSLTKKEIDSYIDDLLRYPEIYDIVVHCEINTWFYHKQVMIKVIQKLYKIEDLDDIDLIIDKLTMLYKHFHGIQTKYCY